jgi:glycosyltransferase involved in cell wall biosynthesis
MPVFNAAPFLTESLQSIQKQTFSDWELLAVDDGSTDASARILAQFAAQDSRIRVFENGKQGIIAALRKAYSESAGAFITRMDADDRMAPQKLERMFSCLEASGPGTVVTGLVKYFSDRGPLGDGYLKYEHWLNKLAISGQPFREIYKECVIPSPCWMVYRSDFEACDAFRPDTYPEDYDLCFRFYAQQLRHQAVEEVLHYWRDHSTRASRNDPNYSDTSFIDLKVPWFLKLDYDPVRPLILWGAGKKGKRIARILNDNKVSFRWVCNTPRRWGTDVYGVRLESTAAVSALEKPQLIIAVAAPDDQQEITSALQAQGLSLGQDFYFFC